MAGLACWFWSKAWQAVGDSLPMSVTELAGDFVPFALPILKGQCDVGDNFDDSNRPPMLCSHSSLQTSLTAYVTE
jgi:hypothetical protein